MESWQGVRCVLLDAVGTLFHVRGSVGAVYTHYASRHGLTPQAELPARIEQRFRACFGRQPPPAYSATDIEANHRLDRAWWQRLVAAVMAGFGRLDFDAFFDDLFSGLGRPDHWQLYPDTLPALQQLQARGLRLGVVSNFDRRLPPLLEGLGVAPYLETVVLPAEAGAAKPDPRIFRLALQRLAADPTTTVHVGDVAAEDVAGAQAAGLGAVLLDRRQAAPPRVEPRLAQLASLADVEKVLGVT